MFGSPEIFPKLLCFGVFFFILIPYKARCALWIFPMLINALAEANRCGVLC